MKRVLVTGGFGFLGSHLLDALAGDPDVEVSVVDNLSSNTADPLGYPSVGWDRRHLRAWLTSGNGPEPGEFDEVYHLASVVGPAGVIPHAGNIVRSIVEDTYALADACRTWGARLLDVSTSEIYGGGQEGLCAEDMPRIVAAKSSARLEYAVAKMAAETALVNTPDLDCVIVRPFNIAGPRQRPDGGFVLPRFVRAAIAGEPLTVFGDGTQVRAFTHVRDVAAGLVLAMARGESKAAYNIGNPNNRTTIADLAAAVVGIARSDSPITNVDPRTIYGPLYEEASDKYPDARKAAVELGWVPDWDLAETIEDTIAWTRQQVSA